MRPFAKANGKSARLPRASELNESAANASEPVLKIFPILLLAGALAVSAQSSEGARRVPSRVTHILVLGDSLSDGFGLTRAQAYPALLANRLHAAGYEVEITNASQSGGTSAGGLQRLPNHLARPLDILVLELGINDAFRGVPVAQIRANLQSIIDQTKERHPRAEIVIAGMQLPIATDDGYVRAFGEMFDELAQKNHAALVPYLLAGVGGDPSLNLDDLIHPNAAGQRILADNVYPALEPLVRKTTAAAPAHVN